MVRTCLRSLQTIFLLGVVLGAGRAALCQVDNHFSAPGIDVTVNSVVRVGTANPALMEVNLAYSFADKDSVWLEGIGQVPATGTLHYCISSPQLVFRTAKRGNELARIPLHQTGFHAAPPDGEPFPSTAFTDSSWLQDGAPLLLDKALPNGTNALINGFRDNAPAPGVLAIPCRMDDEGCIVTHWSSITAPTANVKVQLSLMVIYTAPNPKSMAVKTLFLCRDAFQASSTWNYKLSENSMSVCRTGLTKYRNILNTSLAGVPKS